MRVPVRSRDSNLGFNMTPMIDVVFQLIIFFLVASHLVKQEAHLPLPLPTAGTGNQPAEESGPRVTLNIFENGGLLLAGQGVSLEELPQRLAKQQQLEQGNLEVRIRADRRVPYALVSPVLTACARAGVWNVTFAVHRPEDERSTGD